MEVFWCDDAVPFLSWINIVPGLEQGSYHWIELIGAVLHVNGAWLLSLLELRIQVASGYFDTPSQNVW
jgi:hypothetical protein